ncbi:MAG: lysophospholipid acyltransferase family protein [Chlamydiales bacterium]
MRGNDCTAWPAKKPSGSSASHSGAIVMGALGDSYRKAKSKIFALILSTIGKALASLILKTCKWEIQGLERFQETAAKDKCILMLWHNRLAITSFILYRYAKQFNYAALVSNSRDGELISSLVESYKIGRTIKVPHHSRHEALRMLIRHLQEKDDVVIITPDGPRGPRYQVKPGIALAAVSTGAHIIPLTWQADRFWQLNSWDQLMFPKPFSTIRVIFKEPTHFNDPEQSVEEARMILQTLLPID